MTGLARGRSVRGRRSRWLDAVLGLALIASVRYAIVRRRGTPGDSSTDDGPVVRPSGPPKESTPPAALVDAQPEPEPQPESESTSASADSDVGTDPGTTSNPARGSDAGNSSSGRRVQTDRLTVDEIGSGDLDGVWWPSSTTAAEAIPQLVGDLPEGLGRVLRVALPMPDWSDEKPKTVTVDDRPVHVAWFAGMRRHTARVTFDTDAIITVLVLPPDTGQDAASTALGASAEARSRTQLLGNAGVPDPGQSGTDTDDSGNESRVGGDSEG